MIFIGSEKIRPEDFRKILKQNEPIELDPKALVKVSESFEFLAGFSKNKVIYGINTGFGPMAQFKISDDQQVQLQYNLIRSHSSGTGKILPEELIKAAMISRLNTLMLGYSGINITVVELLRDLINLNVLPVIYEHGGVGASGDLVQLSHLALGLIGEGEVIYQGKLHATKEIFDVLKLKPIQIKFREGLALINGTSVMSGIGIVNILNAKNLLDWSITASAMIIEMVNSYDDHFSHELNSVKLHKGQNLIAKMLRQILNQSMLVKKRDEHLYNGKVSDEVIKDKVQEYYSIRCVPQILGPIIDTLHYAEEVIVNEVNSVNDNPIVDVDNQHVYHGGNFHGDYVSFEMDKIKIATTKLSMLVERQLNFLMNNNLNGILPPFVNLGILGLNLGMQGVQFTATSTVAENQTYSFPMYVHSIPNNNDNQDIVSMGTNSALIANKVIENSFEVMAIHFISIIQAVEYLNIKNEQSPFILNIYNELRKIVPKFVEDTPKNGDILRVKNYLINTILNIEEA